LRDSVSVTSLEESVVISDMRKMAEAFLARPPTEEGQGHTPDQQRLGSLCEPHEIGVPVYVLYPDGVGAGACLRRQEMVSGQSWRAPWIKPGGPNSPYLVPVFKVDRVKGGAKSKRDSTLKEFQRLAEAGVEASPYFEAALRILRAKRLSRYGGGPVGREVPDAYGGAIEEIVREGKLNKDTPLLVVAIDPEGETWPGDDPRLVKWLLTAESRLSIYGKAELPLEPSAVCSLCAKRKALYPNALAGAGLNFVNGAFLGSFPGMTDLNAWRRYAVCGGCADELYVYANHLAPAFIEHVVGSKALIIPSADVAADTQAFGGFIKEVGRMRQGSGRAEGERAVLRRLSDEVTVATLSLLWAESFGQKIDGIRGFVTHVLPSRLAELEKDVNPRYNDPKSRHPFYPRDLRTAVRRTVSLDLKIADELLRRPGGMKFKSENQSPRRRSLLFAVAESVFDRERRLDPGPLWREIGQTAQAYWAALLGQENGGVLYQCFYEAPRDVKEGKWYPLTLNGWVRYLFLFLDYLSDESVNSLPKETVVYEAKQESLRPLLAEARGLDTDEKRFAFLLGVLYGHLIYVQAKKAEVNVAANALSWMKGGRLRAADLPELFGKTTWKLQEYDVLENVPYNKWDKIRDLEAELAHLGTLVGDEFLASRLPDDQVLYFLMLGIALSYTFTQGDKLKKSNPEGGAR
jgi:CRISPR-associated protein Csh1